MKHYTTLQQLRADRTAARRGMSKDMKRIRADLQASLVPTRNSFMHSDNRFFTLVGYAIAGYKAATRVRNAYRFISKWL